MTPINLKTTQKRKEKERKRAEEKNTHHTHSFYIASALVHTPQLTSIGLKNPGRYKCSLNIVYHITYLKLVHIFKKEKN